MYLIKRLFFLLVLFWIILLLPPSQRAVTSYVRGYIERSTGLTTSLEKVDLFFPFVVRLHNLSLSRKNSPLPLIKCQKLSFWPLLLDIPLGRISLFRVRARGLYCDGDKIERWLKSTSTASSSLPTIWISSFFLHSLHLTTSRLPLENNALDCSLKGSFWLSENGNRISSTTSFIKKTPEIWPKQIDLSFEKREAQYTADTTFYLSTRELPSVHRFVFDHDDTLSFSLVADLLPKKTHLSSSTIEKIEGTWNLSCPTSRKRAYHYALETSATAGGTVSFKPGTGISLTCDSFRADICSGTLAQIPEDIESKALIINAPFQVVHKATITTQGTLTGFAKDASSLLWKLSLPSIQINEIEGELKGELSLCPNQNRLLSIASAEGALRTEETEIPIRMNSEGSFEKNDFSLTGDLSASSFHALWDFSHKDGESSHWSSFRCRDLALFAPLLQENIAGRAELSSRFTTNAEKTVSVSANLSDFAFRSLRCGHAILSLSNDTLAPEKISIIGDLATVATSFLNVDRSHLSASYNQHTNALNILDANIVGKLHNQHLDLSTSGFGLIEDKMQSLTLDHLHGVWGKEAISLEHPLYAERRKKFITKLQGSILIGQHSRISGNWCRQTLAKASGDLTLERVPAQLLLGHYLSNQVVGYLDGQCHYQSFVKKVEAKVQINSELVRPQTMGMPRGNIAVGALLTIHNNRLETEICAAGTGIPEPVVITGKTRVTKLPKTPYFTILATAPIRGKAVGNIHLSEMFGPWMPAAAYFDGEVEFDVSAQGPLQKPNFSGPVSLHGGRIDLLPTDEVLTEIEAKARFSKQRLIIEKITGTDGQKGVVKGSGKLTLNPLQWTLNLKCSSLEFISLNYATIQANGSVQLSGTKNALHISGALKTQKALIDLAARFPSDVPEIPFRYKYEEKPKEGPYSVSFDLTIDGKDGLEIRGRGLESIWTGSVHLKGKAAQLFMDGYLRCKEGLFTLASKELTIHSGTITVAGNLFKDSRLNILAITELPSVTARISLKGSLAAPKLSIQSTPPRTDNEILSLVLLNKEYGDISPLESLQLANIAASLEHSSGPFQLIDRVKQTVGIDVIDVGSSPTVAGTGPLRAPPVLDLADGPPAPTGHNDVSLRVGKYISNGVIVSVSRDISSDANRVGVSAPLFKNITAEAEIGDDEVGVISIKWKRDY